MAHMGLLKGVSFHRIHHRHRAIKHRFSAPQNRPNIQTIGIYIIIENQAKKFQINLSQSPLQYVTYQQITPLIWW